ncbi:esterase/lipase family protein [Streptomyces sp. NPDC048258]|uniref:esterase/lipase family protein n=1 Tax=Streptomyces sp. NPDC048258 TaxID=3365527 RepID=UPI00371382A8
MKRPIARLMLALASASLLLLPSVANAAPARDNSASRPVYFVPGFSAGGTHDCWFGYWKKAGEAMWSYGWKGSYHTVSFYGGDTNCNTKVLDGTRNTSIKELGRVLAWNIYSSYSKNNISIDVVAHSMGGLVTRAALTGVARKESGWPPYLYIEDVVTLSTPHQGTGWARGCAPLWAQCADMSPGSELLKWLYDAPQSAQGTDWTLIGAEDDDVVDNESATGMSAGHKVVYHAGQGVGHRTIPEITGGSFRQWYWNYYDNQWHWTTSGGAPVPVANNAVYHWWKW